MAAIKLLDILVGEVELKVTWMQVLSLLDEGYNRVVVTLLGVNKPISASWAWLGHNTLSFQSSAILLFPENEIKSLWLLYTYPSPW